MLKRKRKHALSFIKLSEACGLSILKSLGITRSPALQNRQCTSFDPEGHVESAKPWWLWCIAGIFPQSPQLWHLPGMSEVTLWKGGSKSCASSAHGTLQFKDTSCANCRQTQAYSCGPAGNSLALLPSWLKPRHLFVNWDIFKHSHITTDPTHLCLGAAALSWWCTPRSWAAGARTAGWSGACPGTARTSPTGASAPCGHRGTTSRASIHTRESTACRGITQHHPAPTPPAGMAPLTSPPSRPRKRNSNEIIWVLSLMWSGKSVLKCIWIVSVCSALPWLMEACLLKRSELVQQGNEPTPTECML